MDRRIYIETYGCQMNLADTELLQGHLGEHGFQTTGNPDEADVILVNTCAIREHAEERVVGRLTQLLRHKHRSPDVRLGIVGCMAQHYRARLLDRLPFLDLVLGPDEYRKLPAMLGEKGYDDPQVEVRLGRDETYADIRPARRDGVRAWVSIMRGCDKFCSFCVVPYVRGRERSLPLPLVLEQVHEAAREGFREVVFLGQTVNAYRDGDLDFADLLRATCRIDGIERIRFTSPHPCDMTDRLIDVMGEEERICPQMHLPLQSASNRILSLMNRGYTIEEYDEIVTKLREAKPGIELSTDVIVGFADETEDEYMETREYLVRTGYDQGFLFAYSEREGTRAASWPAAVPPHERQRRLRDLIDLQERILAERSHAWVGRTVEALVEGTAKRPVGWLCGKTREFRTAVFPPGNLRTGDRVVLTVADATSRTLIGRPVSESAAEANADA